MRAPRILAALIALWLAGCATTAPVVPVAVGPAQLGALSLTAGPGWNDLPPSRKEHTMAWTRDGIPIDRLWVFADIAEGETLLEEPKGSNAAFPRFRADMLPNELVAFTESYLGKLFGEGEAIVSTTKVGPQRYGEHDGILFEAGVQMAEAADRKALVGAFVANAKLYLVMYVAADPYYFERNREAAAAVITSARL